jgi:hypothetical protein
LAALWRKVWASGQAGSTVVLRLSRDEGQITLPVTTSDRTKFLRAPRLH